MFLGSCFLWFFIFAQPGDFSTIKALSSLEISKPLKNSIPKRVISLDNEHMDKKIHLDILSHADMAEAQGVLSVYREQTRILEKYGKDDFDLSYNKLFGKYDLYHIHSVNPSFYFFTLKKRKPTIVFVHFLPDTLDGSVKLPKFAFKAFKWYVTSFYKKAKEIVVVNPSFKKELVRFGIDEKKITYIPNFVSHNSFFEKTPEERIALKKEYGLPLDKKTVIAVGQVQTRKGVLDFIRTAEKCPNLNFVWAGGFSFKGITDGYKELKAEMEKERPNLKFLGIQPREKMNDLYNASDIFFLPSFNELFPMALLEACNSGLPYLVRDLDLYKDILLGDYLRASDLEGFASLLNKLGTDEAFYQNAKTYSKEIADTYTEEKNYLLWKDFYTKVYQKYRKKK